MPRTGKPFSVRMTNCGPLGWVSDKAGGYRYQATHPVTGPAVAGHAQRAHRVLGRGGPLPAAPEACLVNHYAAGAKMGSHRDEDEEDTAAPVVSISLGDDATFHVGGLRRARPKAAADLAVRAMWSCSAARRAWPTTASTASTPARRACCPRAGAST